MSDFASTAANLANTDKKSPQTWKPELSSAAEKAALLATDLKGAQVWRPTSSLASSKAATLAAQGHLGRQTSTEISRNNHLSNQAADRKDREGKALLAATKSFANRRLSESDSSTLSRASAQQAALTQLKIAARQQEARSRNNQDPNHGNPMPHVPREMFTEHPPVRLEVEEARRKDALHASAVALAQNAYTIKTQHDTAAADMALQTRSQTPSSGMKQRAMDYLALQDTAQKLATKRLAKIKDSDESADFRSYYGYPAQKNSPTSFLKTIGYRRSTSDETSDRAQSERIRSQMTLLQAQIAQVDTNKRDQDRQHVREAAERNVHDRMHKLDETVFNQTGKMSPAMVEEWDAKARARITEQRATSEKERQPADKIDLGGGMYIDQSEIDAIAEARVRPTLDNIDEAVGKKKAADTEAKLNDDEKKRHVLLEKQRKKDQKGEQKHVRELEKKERKEKAATERMLSKTEHQINGAREAEDLRISAKKKRQALQDSEPPEEVGHKVSRMHRLSLGLHKKEKSTEVAEPSLHSPRKLKSFVNRLKRKSGSHDPKSTKDESATDAIHTVGANPDSEALSDMVDSRQGSPDLPDDDSFEDAEEHQGVDHDPPALYDLSLAADYDGPARHRLSLSNRSDSTHRESKFHEQLDTTRE